MNNKIPKKMTFKLKRGETEIELKCSPDDIGQILFVVGAFSSLGKLIKNKIEQLDHKGTKT